MWQQSGHGPGHLPESVSTTYAYLLTENEVTPQNLRQQTFIETQWNQAPLTYSDLDVWLRIGISNSASTSVNLSLMLDNPLYNRIEVLRISDSGVAESILLSGDKTNTASRAQLALPEVRFSTGASQSMHLYIHAQTDGSPVLPLILQTTDAADQTHLQLYLIWGIFIGTVLLMSAYNLVLYLGLKDIAYLSYIGYILTMLLLLGAVHGFGYYLFPLTLQQFLMERIITLNTVAAAFTFLFAKHFLRFNRSDGLSFRAGQLFLYLLALFFLLSLFIPEYQAAQWFSLVQSACYAMVLWLLIHRVPGNLSWTRYYLVSWVPFFVGAAIAYLLFSGVIPYTFFNRHAFAFSVVFEMALISMALTDRFANLERDRLYRATHDYVSGLANEALLKEAIDRHTRKANSELCLLAVEVSNLDAIRPYLQSNELNDLVHALSLEIGSELSRQRTLYDIDSESIYYRYTALMRGEVLCFLLNCNSTDDLAQLLNSMTDRDNYNPLKDSIPFRIQCRFGLAIQTDPIESSDQLITEARRALHEAKASSKPFHIYQSSQERDRSHHIRLAQDLVSAIESNELLLYHQPQLLLHDPELMASEVLLRWQHPKQGMIPTNEVIAVAEQTGLIRSLTRWVLRQSFQQARQLLDDGRPLYNLSINISANDLSRSNFANELIQEFSEWRLDASLFTLEVTESTHLSDQYHFQQNFKILKDAGFRFAIDDFGTGYSSLSYASEHPFSELKIDRSFVLHLPFDARHHTIVSATVSMAKKLQLSVTAEGVEDDATAQILYRLGCDKLQGYLFARPMPFEKYSQWQIQPDQLVFMNEDDS